MFLITRVDFTDFPSCIRLLDVFFRIRKFTHFEIFVEFYQKLVKNKHF